LLISCFLRSIVPYLEELEEVAAKLLTPGTEKSVVNTLVVEGAVLDGFGSY
jgi:hypothetical protein